MHNLFKQSAIGCVIALATHFTGAAQEVGLKTNLLSDAALSPAVAAEITVAPKWSAELGGSVNLWTLSHGRRWKHWAIQPEARYWLCEPYTGHFFGVEAHGGQYNIGHFNLGLNLLGTDFRKLRDYRFQGWFVGGGITYGYSWILGRHWNMEAELGLGYSYTRYDQYRCRGCGKKVRSDKSHNYVGPTKAAVNIVYVF